MVVRGHVHNGVVVLDPEFLLPDGLEVTVMTPDERVPLSRGQGPHSVLEIPAVCLGTMLRPLSRDDELLEEMLEGRPMEWTPATSSLSK